jgi:2-amino-4-hydroxy-6-hydroxymethyldihydropteridine diphosphokinase
MPLAFLALGSNLGDRRAHLSAALEALRQAGVSVERVSSLYETRPVGGPAGQGDYLNACVQVRTQLEPLELLRLLLRIEESLGRVRRERFDPRSIDLDLLLYEDRVLADPELTLPHPRLHERLFVLIPLAEIAPGAIHPVLHRTVAELLGELQALRTAGPSPGRELTGLRALVTGSSSGIGRAIALELATAGADVIIHGRDLPRAEAVVAEARLAGVRSQALIADLSHPFWAGELAVRAWGLWDGIDILVNNAGADTLTGEAARWSFEQKLDALLAVDLKATIQLARLVGPEMKERGNGVIVNMGWDQAETGMEGDSGELFATVKGAVMSFSRSLALSLAPEVRVHCVAPGWIRTAWGEGASSVWQERVRRETPLRRWGTPADVAAVVRWLVSPAAGYLTGQVVRINGGAVRG